MLKGRPYRVLAAFVVLAWAFATAGCGSTSVTEISAPSDLRCATSLTANPQSLGPDGGDISIAVTTTRDCNWTSASDAPWIRLSTASGQGEATFTAIVDANAQITARTGSVSVNSQRVAITQAGRPCTFDLGSTDAQFGAAGGSSSIEVSTLAGCSWRATTTESWIQVPPAAVSGPGRVAFQVAANDGGERSGVITIADKSFVVSQAAAPPGSDGSLPQQPNCTPAVAPLSIDASAAASTQNIQIGIGATCPWSASSGASWLTITSPQSGTGPATLTVSVGANSGAARSGTLTIAGQLVTVRQTAVACTFTLNPTSQNVTAAGGNGRFTVTTAAVCSWSASKSVPWIDMIQGTGTGTGDATFNVRANTTTTARSGTITVGGQTFTVNQAAAACTYSLSPASLDFPLAGGHGQFTVTTSSNCSWSAVAAAEWVDVANRSGSGTSTINFNVAANGTTAARTTTISVGGQTFTVNQAAPACSFAVDPSSANIAAAGGQGQFTVTAGAGCTWSVTGAPTWLSISMPQGGNGTGTADVVYVVQPNSDATPRTAVLAVANQTFTVTQAAAAPVCTYTLDSPSASLTAVGGTGTFTVTTQPACTWTPATVETWITLADTDSRTGSGTVSYTVQPNATGAPRTGAITAGGQTYTVTQAQ